MIGVDYGDEAKNAILRAADKTLAEVAARLEDGFGPWSVNGHEIVSARSGARVCWRTATLTTEERPHGDEILDMTRAIMHCRKADDVGVLAAPCSCAAKE